MRDDEIFALAKGMVPFVHEYVVVAIGKAMLVSDELAGQVANAVKMLHEQSPPTQRDEPQSAASPKITCIKRDENGDFVPMYEPQK